MASNSPTPPPEGPDRDRIRKVINGECPPLVLGEREDDIEGGMTPSDDEVKDCMLLQQLMRKKKHEKRKKRKVVHFVLEEETDGEECVLVRKRKLVSAAKATSSSTGTTTTTTSSSSGRTRMIIDGDSDEEEEEEEEKVFIVDRSVLKKVPVEMNQEGPLAYFERCMCLYLGIPLDKIYTFRDFLVFLSAMFWEYLFAKERQGRGGEEIVGGQRRHIGTLAGRHVLMILEREFDYWEKKVRKWLVTEPFLKYYVNEIENPVPTEYNLLYNKGALLQGGTGFGYPSVLAVTFETDYVISDCGESVDEARHSNIDLQTFILKLVALFATMSMHNTVRNTDCIRISHSNYHFRYKWTIRFGDKLIEISFLSMGLVNCFNWEKYEHDDVQVDEPRSTTTTRYKKKQRDVFTRYYLNQIFIPKVSVLDVEDPIIPPTLYYGKDGIAKLLLRIFERVDPRSFCARLIEKPTSTTTSSPCTYCCPNHQSQPPNPFPLGHRRSRDEEEEEEEDDDDDDDENEDDSNHHYHHCRPPSAATAAAAAAAAAAADLADDDEEEEEETAAAAVHVEETTTDERDRRNGFFPITSVLEVFPISIGNDVSLIPPQQFSNLVNGACRHGEEMRKRGGFRQSDIQFFNKIQTTVTSYVSSKYFNIPSDTGLVLLQTDLTLVASRNIPAGTPITSLPVVLATSVCCDDPRPLIIHNDRPYVVIKKCIPFGGMGCFATHTTNPHMRTNSRIVVANEETLIYLVATCDIKPNERIAYYCNEFGQQQGVDINIDLGFGSIQDYLHQFYG